MEQIDYKEKYEQAMERARQFFEKPYLEDSAGIVGYIFPELKESEDEKIRKCLIAIITDFESLYLQENYALSKEDALAWLEKQGQTFTNKDVDDAYLKGVCDTKHELEKQGEQNPNYCHHEVDLSNCSEEYRKAYYDGWNNCNMQYSQCKSELDDVVKCLINGMKFYYEDNEEATWGTDKWSMPVKHIIEVLEKQGGQKEKQYITITQKILDYIGKYEYSFENSIPKLGDSWKVIKICKYPSVNGGKPVVEVVNEGSGDWMRLPLNIVDIKIEQNSTDKVEPKFHDGEWITNGDYTWKIVEVEPLDYILQSQDGNIVDDTISHVDEQFHSFTIEDAKGGDVLADGNLPFIFKKIDSNKYSYAYCGISADDGFRIESDGELGEWTWMQDIKPATKEQCDQLEKAMADAGYTFDFEEKELKKIEQKPDTQHSTEWSVSDFRTWQYIVSDVLTKKDGIGQYLDSGECKKIAKYMQEEWGGKLGKEQTQEELPNGKDYGIDGLYAAIDILKTTLGKVDGYQTDDGILEHKCAISAVKSLYEQKPAWSEEDKRIIDNLISQLGNLYARKLIKEETKDKYVNWLKSIKERCTWKPSGFHLECISDAIAMYQERGINAIGLKEILEELKKIREE